MSAAGALRQIVGAFARIPGEPRNAAGGGRVLSEWMSGVATGWSAREPWVSQSVDEARGGGADADRGQRWAADERRWSELMAAAHRGDSRAYATLLTELADAIQRYVERRFGPLTFIEDCVQECLLAIHNGRHTYDPKRRFRPWLFTIVRNRTIDLLRSAYGGRELADTMSAETTSLAAGPVEELEAGELLSRLEPAQRHALTLTKVCGYSLAEAAERAGVSESAMKSRVSRALRAAAELLQQEAYGE